MRVGQYRRQSHRGFAQIFARRGLNSSEISAFKAATTTFDKARDGTACTARIFGAIDWLLIERKAIWVDLNDVDARDQPLKMIAAILICDCICAVLKHHTDALDALRLARIDGATTFGYSTHQRETLADTVADNANCRVCGFAGCAAVVRSGCQIDRVAGACVLPDFGQIG